MTVNPSKMDAVLVRMNALGINDRDLEERFILGAGKGGQKVNKTASCVVLSYAPLNIVVKCQKDRSREVNRVLARRLLCDKVEQALTGKVEAKEQEIQKKRQQKKRRKRKSAEKYGANESS